MPSFLVCGVVLNVFPARSLAALVPPAAIVLEAGLMGPEVPSLHFPSLQRTDLHGAGEQRRLGDVGFHSIQLGVVDVVLHLVPLTGPQAPDCNTIDMLPILAYELASLVDQQGLGSLVGIVVLTARFVDSLVRRDGCLADEVLGKHIAAPAR
eukprot:scaffold1217_cov250-Pinguiococcus_pyrenoidosus.AAC.3